MTKQTVLFSLAVLYAHIAICCCYKWISTLPTFKEPDSQPLYRIVEDHDDVYVAGRNVLYSLGSELDRPVKFVTGPELDHPQCFLDQPCDMQKQMRDNDNQVLDVLSHQPFDSVRRMLLVCGTLYHGLCQLRDLRNISEYHWIKPYNNSLGFSTIAPSLYRKTYTFTGDDINFTIWWSVLRDGPAVRTPSSPPFLSSKILVEENNDFRFQYPTMRMDSTMLFDGNATSEQHRDYNILVSESISRECLSRRER